MPRRTHLVGIAIALFCCFGITRADDKPAAPAPPYHGEPAVTIGEMRVQTVPAMTYLHTEANTSFKAMADPVKAAFDKVFAAVMAGNLHTSRTMMV